MKRKKIKIWTSPTTSWFPFHSYTTHTMSDNEDVLFDEFGNPINESLSSSSSSGDNDSDSETENILKSDINLDGHIDKQNTDQDGDVIPEEANEIVLAEDKTYYPSLSSTFGNGVETIIATEDAKSLAEPMIEPLTEKKFTLEESSLPETTYSKDYMWQTSSITERVRNISFCGNIHSGKTSIVDMLVNQTHDFKKKDNDDTQLRYTDNHILETKKKISIKSTAISLLLPDLNDSSMLLNIIDSPGHSNFIDEMALSIRMSDTVVLCIDVIESVTETVELIIEYAIKTNTKMMLMLTKLDRLILELRLPPLEAYYKIRRTIEEVNLTIRKYCKELKIDVNDEPRLSPEMNNVCFSSSVFNIIFNLTSFTKVYFEANNLNKNTKFSVDSFSRKLWGDIYFENNKFFVKPENALESANSRTFIKFILSPIYKLTTATLSLDAPELETFIETKMRLRIPKSKYKLDTKPFFKILFTKFLGVPSKALVDSLISYYSPLENSIQKLNYLYTGPRNSEIAEHIKKCDAEGPLIAYISKLVDTVDSEHFYAFIRVLSGSIKQNSKVILLGESYSNNNNNDYKIQKINNCYMWCGRYKINVPELKAGSIGLIAGPGLDSFIVKSASIYGFNFQEYNDDLFIFKGNDKIIDPIFKIALQSFNPKDLNKFLDGLKKINKAYIGCEINVDDNGEYSIFGYGELYMDCLLHDLRILYGDIDIKLSDPMVKFHETTDMLSRVKLTIKSNNGKNSISIISEPLDNDLSEDITRGLLNVKFESARAIAKKLRNVYKWDSLAARSVWSLGPNEENGTCILCDDTLPDEVDKSLLNEYKDIIIKGFQWAIKEGPLCDEQINDVKFKIIDISFAKEEIDRNNSQIIQMVRNACHASLLIGEPKLLEPIYKIEIIVNFEVVDSLDVIIEKRRGFFVEKERIDGSPLWKVIGYIPVIESVGLEVDLRLSTRGLAYPQLIFSKWESVPGNPLDDSAYLPILRRVPIESSSRDFMIKTRRRKGLSDDISIEKYLDSKTWSMLQELEIV